MRDSNTYIRGNIYQENTKKYMSLVLGIQKHWKTYWNITDIILFLEIHVFKEKIWNKEKLRNQEVKIKLN